MLSLSFFMASNAYAEQIFGYVGFRMNSFGGLPRWERVLSRLEQEGELFKLCDENIDYCSSPALAGWRDFMSEQQGLTRLQQVKAVNKFVNRWPYITDDQLWGLSDYWATPMEFLEHSGDCEDYSILKYISLRELGVPAEDLRILVVRDVVRDIAHAILGVRVDGKWMILDSLFTAVLGHDKMLQYTPYYAVNEESRWTYIPPLRSGKRKFR